MAAASCQPAASGLGAKPLRIVPGLLERLLVERGGRRVVEDEDVVRLDVEAADAEVRRAAEHLQTAVSLRFWIRTLSCEKRWKWPTLTCAPWPASQACAFGSRAVPPTCAGGVVEVEAQPRPELAELLDHVRLVEVVGEDVERTCLVGERLGEEVEHEPPGVEAEPVVLLLVVRRVEVERGRRRLDRSVVELFGVRLRGDVPAREAEQERRRPGVASASTLDLR